MSTNSSLTQLYGSEHGAASLGVLCASVAVLALSWYSIRRRLSPNGQTSPTRASRDYRDGQITITKLLIHPIKSCRGSSVQSSAFTSVGLEHDRRWVLVGLDKSEVLTARTVPKMVLVHPRVNQDSQTLDVTFPADSGCTDFSVPLNPSPDQLSAWTLLDGLNLFSIKTLDGYICESLPGHANASEELSRFLGLRVALVLKGPRRRAVDSTPTFPSLHEDTSVLFHDGYPVLLVSEESLEDVERRTWEIARAGDSDRVDAKWKNERLVMERFRPNIVVRGAGGFAEDDWEEVRIGSEGYQMDLVSKCPRCQLPQVDPATGVPDAAIPTKVLATFRKGIDPAMPHKNCFGSNGVPRASGVISVGDVVRVARMTADGSVAIR
ncbi:hypothetical protein EXIGLDRAFT_616305 [Exidia glandulosa HHB12029]|uniref:MOSC domain-containing protein n=1 Tax=Exidia glandulosa HHB12029 TaxID=1314781 RepID=A0A165GRP2_EXIGL|nr:hypothetical protein EXIGLDRAFT_616305 [Exidia glandulosa HHB12029]